MSNSASGAPDPAAVLASSSHGHSHIQTKAENAPQRRLPVGAEIQPDGSVHFRVWAPDSKHAAIEIVDANGAATDHFELSSEPGGYFSGASRNARAGSLYKIRLESGLFPDPVSRFQPKGPHGPSQVIDPTSFRWTDANWKGRPVAELVLYELHLGTFTREGTWRAAAAQLEELKRLGITLVAVMPVAEFPGEFGWGYDGVDIFAPYHVYGDTEDARAFVNRCHELELMVILDVVYNHLGPDGNYLRPFSKTYFSETYECEWGHALNFDGPGSQGAREFFLSNVRHWIDEYHFDGLRLDATQQIFDASPVHILQEMGQVARDAGGRRQIFMVAENESQESRLVRPYQDGGYGLDAVWNDDFHHAAMVAATGRVEAYYTDYRGTAQEFVSAFKHGFLFQGQWYNWQKKRRGFPAWALEPHRFVVFLQNHDQVANSLRGARLHQLTSPGLLKTLTALTLLSPSTPMLFQGQEFAANAPFVYFADHGPELSEQVREGRHRSLWQFRSMSAEDSRSLLAEPSSRRVFESCKLDFSERKTHAALYRLHYDLLKLRREEKAITAAAWIDGAVLSTHAFVIRFFAEDGDDRLLLANLGPDLFYNPAPEPLLAPLEGRGWATIWSSESPDYDGSGTPHVETTAGWILPGFAAVLLKPNDHAELPRPRLSAKD